MSGAILAREAQQREASGERYICGDQMRDVRLRGWHWAAITPIVLAALTLPACGGGGEGSGPSDSPPVIITTPTVQPTRIARRTATPTDSPAPPKTPLAVCGSNPDPARSSLLQVQEPVPEQQVKVPFHVRGWGSTIGVQNAGVALAIVNAKQEIVQVLNLPPLPNAYRLPPPGLEVTPDSRPFAADIVIEKIKEPTPYCIWVYQETTEEGKPKGVVQVPVVVVP